MESPNDFNYLLFVYGLLRKGIDHHMSRLLNIKANYIGMGAARGKLFLIDNYPGMIIDMDSESQVYGDIYGFNDAILWKFIDGFEEIDISDEYKKQKIEVDICDQKLNCWSYVYQRSTDRLEYIPSGDFLEYIRKK